MIGQKFGEILSVKTHMKLQRRERTQIQSKLTLPWFESSSPVSTDLEVALLRLFIATLLKDFVEMSIKNFFRFEAIACGKSTTFCNVLFIILNTDYQTINTQFSL
jgi:hypothetical protein